MVSLTPSQQRAVAARGNVLVVAGAGTGKTRTLIERCLDCLGRERVALDQILIVTFTDAAATEVRERLRTALEARAAAHPDDAHWREQLALFDIAPIGTLHGFCLRLVREHFQELGLDPQFAILEEGETRLLAAETLTEQFDAHYESDDEFSVAVQDLIRTYGNGRDEPIQSLILRLHRYAETRPDAAGWLAEGIRYFSAPEPGPWRDWFSQAVLDWRREWIETLADLRAENVKAAECAEILAANAPATELLQRILATDGKENFPPKKYTALRKPLEGLFADAEFLNSLAGAEGADPMREDWNWIRGHMQTLLRLTQAFSERFLARKQAEGGMDFHDLEQSTLKLLWNARENSATEIARRWREKLHFVFVDEYQDINAAQDRIIAALSREDDRANRFLVGDVKQSIYRFRLADPKIFHGYARRWTGTAGQAIPLSENFRSRDALLQFVNALFESLMREEIGGTHYDAGARLQAGLPSAAGDSPRVELWWHLKDGDGNGENGDEGLADLEEAEKEARMLALRIRELKESGHLVRAGGAEGARPVDWRDFAVLLRSPSGKAEIFAKQFERAGVPLLVERGGFYDSGEILDLLSLLQLLDNPLQDVPCIAVLRSPFVALSLDDLAEIRLRTKGHFWFALQQAAEAGREDAAREKIRRFLERFADWRRLARQVSLSACLEEILASTHYDDWLRRQPRGAQRQANIKRFLHLAQKFDRFQRQGLFRFLNFVQAQRDAEIEPEIAATAEDNAVRLMSVHQSKGLEFPVVAVADLAKAFNEQDQRAEIILDEAFGLCPRVKPPAAGGRYPSLPYWLAQKNQRRELRGEELRLLYVALTRAKDTLILTGSIARKKWPPPARRITSQTVLAAKSFRDWLMLWLGKQRPPGSESEGTLAHLRWRLVDDNALKVIRAEEKQAGTVWAEPDEATASRLRQVLEWEYPFALASRRAAKTSVTVLRRQQDDREEEARQEFAPAPHSRMKKPVVAGKAPMAAADVGIAHHTFLQYVALEKVTTAAGLQAEAGRLEQEKYLAAEERAALDLKKIAAFWNSSPGKKFLAQSASVRRELAFTARFSMRELDEIFRTPPVAGLESEFVVVQGIADLAVLLPEEIWLLDFKTDEVTARDLPGKVEFYRPQLELYARALQKIYRRAVTFKALHFLSPNRTVIIA